MKSKVLFFIGIMAFTLFVCSCGGNTGKLQFDGMYCENDNIFSVADGNYLLESKVVDGDTLLVLKVKLTLTKSTKAEVDDYPEIVLKDKDGMELFDSWCQLDLFGSNDEKFDKFIAGKLGREGEFLFAYEFDKKDRDKALQETRRFAVVDFVLEEEEEEEEIDYTSVSSEVDALMDVAKEAAKLSKDVDVKKAQSDAEDALKVAGQAMKTAGKMLEALEELEGMDDLDDIW